MKKLSNRTVPKVKLETDGNKEMLSPDVPEGMSKKDWTKNIKKSMGVNSGELAAEIIRQITLVLPDNGKGDVEKLNATIAMYCGIEPRDHVEALLAAQLVTTHNLSQKFLAQACIENMPLGGTETLVNLATKAQRTMLAAVEALRKYRTNGEQLINVQHVSIESGAQGVVVGSLKGVGRG